LLLQRSKHPREKVITPKASTSMFLSFFERSAVQGSLRVYPNDRIINKGIQVCARAAKTISSTLPCPGTPKERRIGLGPGPGFKVRVNP